MMKNKKAQAAMEFLMTYGWAVLVVLLAIGALAYFGVLSPQNLLPEQTIFQAPLPNLDNGVVSASENSVEVAFKNNKGVAITLPLTGNLTADGSTDCTFNTISATYNGAAVVANTTSIPNGDNFLVKWDCDAPAQAVDIGDKFSADMFFAYTNVETGQDLSHTGSVDGKYS